MQSWYKFCKEVNFGEISDPITVFNIIRNSKIILERAKKGQRRIEKTSKIPERRQKI